MRFKENHGRATSYHLIAAAIAAAGASVLIYWCRLGRTLWVDEEMLALNARWRSFADLAGPLWLNQTAPLGWLMLERAALVMFGINERAARAVPALFGIGTLAVAVWVGRRWMTPVGAAVLAALCSIAPWIVFFALELKHYSADMCWALFLPALAAWAAEGERSSVVDRRLIIWWIAAAAGLWLSNGATFVTPACAAVLVARVWWREGARAATRAALLGIIWLISFGAHYTLALRHALANEYLRNFWRFAFPPISDGVAATLQWLGSWFQDFAEKPIGTSHWVMFWLATIIGFVYAAVRYGVLGLTLALVPVSMIALGLFQIVPPRERLAAWAVPGLYTGLALCADAGLWLLTHPGRARRWTPRPLRIGVAIAALLMTGIVSLDIARSGTADLAGKPVDSNYGLEDRRAVRFLTALRHSGDPILTTHFGLAGLWWYGDVDVTDPQRGEYLGDSQIFEISHESRRSRCSHYEAELDAVLQKTSRAVVYLGFRTNVEPLGFDRLVVDELSRRGALVGYRHFADASHVFAFDFREPPDGTADRLFTESSASKVPPAEGCVAIRPAQRW
jgi:hypothetical protein